MRARIVALVGPSGGYTLIELLVTMSILGTVLAGLAGLFVSATSAEVDLRTRFEAQQDVRSALDSIRREAHCARTVSVPSADRVTLTLPSYCRTGSGEINWCASGTQLRRVTGTWTACTGGAVRAEFLTSTTVFTTVAPAAGELPKLRVDLRVDADPRTSAASYRLFDDIVLRNTIRS